MSGSSGWQYLTHSDPPDFEYETPAWREIQQLERHLARVEHDLDELTYARRQREHQDTDGGRMEPSVRGRQLSEMDRVQEDRLRSDAEQTLLALAEQIDKADIRHMVTWPLTEETF